MQTLNLSDVISVQNYANSTNAILKIKSILIMPVVQVVF